MAEEKGEKRIYIGTEIGNFLSGKIYDEYCRVLNIEEDEITKSKNLKNFSRGIKKLNNYQLTLAYMIALMNKLGGATRENWNNAKEQILNEMESIGLGEVAKNNTEDWITIWSSKTGKMGPGRVLDPISLDNESRSIRRVIDNAFKAKRHKAIKQEISTGTTPLKPTEQWMQDVRTYTGGTESGRKYVKDGSRVLREDLLGEASEKNRRAKIMAGENYRASLVAQERNSYLPTTTARGIGKGAYLSSILATALVTAIGTSYINEWGFNQGINGESKHEQTIGENKDDSNTPDDEKIKEAIQKLEADMDNNLVTMTTEERNALNTVIGLLQSNYIDDATVESINTIKKATVMELLKEANSPYGSEVSDYKYENGELVLTTDTGPITVAINDTNLQGALENGGKEGLADAILIRPLEITIGDINLDTENPTAQLVIQEHQQNYDGEYANGYNDPSGDDYGDYGDY